MSKKYKGRIPEPFFWVFQATVKSDAWKANLLMVLANPVSRTGIGELIGAGA
jgi:hypothetical protein